MINYLTGMIPARLRNGTEIATHSVAQHLKASGVKWSYVGYLRSGEAPIDASFVSSADVRPIEVYDAPRLMRIYWILNSVVRGIPASVSKYDGVVVKRKFAQHLSSSCGVLVDKPQLAWIHKRALNGRKVSIIWHSVDSKTYSSVARSYKGLNRWIYNREARLCRIMEYDVASWVKHVFVFSPDDAYSVREMGFKGKIDILPIVAKNSGEANAHQPSAGVALLGAWTWSANKNGLDWFVDHVAPLLQVHGIKIDVGGLGADHEALRAAGINYVGPVESAAEFLGNHSVVVIPLVSGTGISMKVLEAISAGWPTVTTPIGVRGLHDLPDSVLVSQDPAEFAAHILAMLAATESERQIWKEKGAIWHSRREESFGRMLKEGLDSLTEGEE